MSESSDFPLISPVPLASEFSRGFVVVVVAGRSNGMVSEAIECATEEFGGTQAVDFATAQSRSSVCSRVFTSPRRERESDCFQYKCSNNSERGFFVESTDQPFHFKHETLIGCDIVTTSCTVGKGESEEMR